MLQISGRLVPKPAGAPIAGYAVEARLNTVVPDPNPPGGAAPQDLTVLVSALARTDPTGEFALDLDPAGQPQSPVTLIISAPNGVELLRQDRPLDDLGQPLEITVPAVAPIVVAPADDPDAGKRVRLLGQVIDVKGRGVPAGLPVVLWGVPLPPPPVDGGQPPAPQPERPLVITQTQVGGGFSADWTSLALQSAVGRVSGGTAQPIQLTAQNQLPLEILLVVDLDALPPDPATQECGDRPPRAPDPADLTANPQAFAQDLGGGCVDLTMPNRTLEEFSYFTVVRTSEPAIHGLTLGVRRLVPSDLLTDLLGVSMADAAMTRSTSKTLGVPSARRALGKLSIDLDSAADLVRSDRPPTFDQIERAVWLSEAEDTRRLIYAALQDRSGRSELTVNTPIDWDETPTINLSIEVAHGHILRYREVWRADGYSLGDLLYSLPLAPGQRRRVAVVDWNRRTESERADQLDYEEQLDALLSRDRDIMEIVGSNLHEETSGGSRNTTWGVAGGIGAGFIGSGFGIFGGVAGGAGGSDTTAWMRSARQFSADSLQQLRDRVGQRASSLRSLHSTVVQTVAQNETLRAETEIVANYNHCHAITIEYFEVLRHFLITHELADVQECVFVPLPITEFTRGKALRWRETLRRYLKDRSLAEGFESIERIVDNWVGWDYPTGSYAEEAPENLEGELRISFVLPRPRDDKDGAFQVDMWKPYSWLLNTDTLELWTAKLNARTAAERDQVFRQEIAPTIAANLVQSLTFAYVAADGSESPVSLDASLVSRYQEGEPLYVSINPAGGLPNVSRQDIAYFKIGYNGPALPPDARVIVHSGRMRYSTPHITALLFDAPRILDDLNVADNVIVSTPPSRRELRNPRQEDEQRAAALLTHLNAHLEYYHQAIWVNLDPQRRYMLLDSIILPATGPRQYSVASVCTNELIGVVGNSLVLPLAPGQKLDPTIEIPVDDQGRPARLEDAYQTPPSAPLRVSVPTRGVYAEAVAGECDACEAIDDSRYWRWTTAGQLALPEIQTVDTGTRASAEETLSPTELPKPLVSIQNAPEIPQPFSLGDAFGLLSKPELFRDITGLEGTQKNAAAAFDAAVSAASALGGEAFKLAKQNEVGRNADRMLSRIEQAQRDGLLSPETAHELANTTLGTLVGEPPPKPEEPAKDQAVEKVIDKAAQGSKADIKVSSADETVEVSFTDDAPTAVGGGGVTPRQIDLTHYVTEPLKIDMFDNTGAYVRATFDTLAKVKAAFGPTEFADLEARNLLTASKVDPAKAQFEQRLRIVYPGDPAKANTVSGKGRLPLMVLVHGQHQSWLPKGVPLPTGVSPVDRVVPNHTGYTYLQNALAADKIISVSVDVNMANRINSHLDLRTRMIFTALAKLRQLDKDPNSPLYERIDFDNIGLMGHSRGGDAVVRFAKDNKPLLGDNHYGVKLVVSLAPTDVSGVHPSLSPAMALDATETSLYGVVYGGLDGDVSGVDGAKGVYGTGFRHYDRATCNKAMAFIEFANHNRFNDVWDPDESGMDPADLAVPGGRLLSRASHRKLAIEYIGAMVRYALLKDTQSRGLFTASKTNSLAVGVSLQWQLGTAVTSLDQMEDTTKALVGTRTLTQSSIEKIQDIVVGAAPNPVCQLEEETCHQTGVLKVNSMQAAATTVYRLALTGSDQDWSNYDSISLRVCADSDLSTLTSVSAGSLPEFSLIITDSSGSSSTFAVKPSGSQNPFINAPLFPTFHRLSSGDNCSVHHLETLEGDLAVVRLNPSGALLSQIAVVELQVPANYPKLLFFDSLCLRKF